MVAEPRYRSTKRFELQLTYDGENWREALKTWTQHQTLRISGDSQVIKSRVHAGRATIVLGPPEAVEGDDSGAWRRNSSPIPKTNSKSDLKRSRPDAFGRFAVMFENPLTRRDAGRWALDPEKHQVVFQIAVNDGGKLEDKLLKQVPAREAGGYRVDVQLDPELIDDSSIAVTFVTIQPDHDEWVTTFFAERRGTAYRGIWAADSLQLAQIALDGEATGWTDVIGPDR